jgi:hypothetical protein
MARIDCTLTFGSFTEDVQNQVVTGSSATRSRATLTTCTDRRKPTCAREY